MSGDNFKYGACPGTKIPGTARAFPDYFIDNTGKGEVLNALYKEYAKTERVRFVTRGYIEKCFCCNQITQICEYVILRRI